MTRHLVQTAALILAASTSSAGAQRTLRSVGDDFKNAGADMLHIWTGPFHATKSDWLGAAGALGATLLVMPLDDDVDRFVVNNPGSFLVRGNPFRENRRGDLGDLATGKRMQPIAGALYVIGFAANSRALRDAAVGCAGMQVGNSLLRKGLIYKLIARPRPDSAQALGKNQYDVSVPGAGWGYHSFPAGHFMNAIGCASFLGNRFQMGFAEPLIYAAALGIGAARITDRRHWTSDSMLSLVAGYAIGRTIALRQLHRLERAPSVGATSDQGQAKYVVSWGTTF